MAYLTGVEFIKRSQWFILAVVMIVSLGGFAPTKAEQQVCAFQDSVTTYYVGYEESPFSYVAPFIDDKVSIQVAVMTGKITRIEFYFGKTKVGNVPLMARR